MILGWSDGVPARGGEECPLSREVHLILAVVRRSILPATAHGAKRGQNSRVSPKHSPLAAEKTPLSSSEPIVC